MDLRCNRTHFPAQFYAAAVGKADVEYCDIRLEIDDLLQGVMHIAGITDDIEVVFGVDEVDQATSDHFVVIDDEDPERHVPPPA